MEEIDSDCWTLEPEPMVLFVVVVVVVVFLMTTCEIDVWNESIKQLRKHQQPW